MGRVYKTVTKTEFEESAAAAADADFQSREAIDHASIYDTSQYGRSNTGHTFGDNLTTDERSAIIEFLKSLSGPSVGANAASDLAKNDSRD